MVARLADFVYEGKYFDQRDFAVNVEAGHGVAGDLSYHGTVFAPTYSHFKVVHTSNLMLKEKDDFETL